MQWNVFTADGMAGLLREERAEWARSHPLTLRAQALETQRVQLRQQAQVNAHIVNSPYLAANAAMASAGFSKPADRSPRLRSSFEPLTPRTLTAVSSRAELHIDSSSHEAHSSAFSSTLATMSPCRTCGQHGSHHSPDGPHHLTPTAASLAATADTRTRASPRKAQHDILTHLSTHHISVSSPPAVSSLATVDPQAQSPSSPMRARGDAQRRMQAQSQREDARWRAMQLEHAAQTQLQSTFAAPPPLPSKTFAPHAPLFPIPPSPRSPRKAEPPSPRFYQSGAPTLLVPLPQYLPASPVRLAPAPHTFSPTRTHVSRVAHGHDAKPVSRLDTLTEVTDSPPPVNEPPTSVSGVSDTATSSSAASASASSHPLTREVSASIRSTSASADDEDDEEEDAAADATLHALHSQQQRSWNEDSPASEESHSRPASSQDRSTAHAHAHETQMMPTDADMTALQKSEAESEVNVVPNSDAGLVSDAAGSISDAALAEESAALLAALTLSRSRSVSPSSSSDAVSLIAARVAHERDATRTPAGLPVASGCAEGEVGSTRGGGGTHSRKESIAILDDAPHPAELVAANQSVQTNGILVQTMPWLAYDAAHTRDAVRDEAAQIIAAMHIPAARTTTAAHKRSRSTARPSSNTYVRSSAGPSPAPSVANRRASSRFHHRAASTAMSQGTITTTTTTRPSHHSSRSSISGVIGQLAASAAPAGAGPAHARTASQAFVLRSDSLSGGAPSAALEQVQEKFASVNAALNDALSSAHASIVTGGSPTRRGTKNAERRFTHSPGPIRGHTLTHSRRMSVSLAQSLAADAFDNLAAESIHDRLESNRLETDVEYSRRRALLLTKGPKRSDRPEHDLSFWALQVHEQMVEERRLQAEEEARRRAEEEKTRTKSLRRPAADRTGDDAAQQTAGDNTDDNKNA